MIVASLPLETLLFVSLIGVAMLPLLWRATSPVATATTVILVMCGASIFAAGWMHRRDNRMERDAQTRASIPLRERNGFTSSDACKACHPGPYASWYASYHRTMTQVPRPADVAAPFQGTVLKRLGVTYSLDHEGEDFWVRSDRAGERVVMMTGSHHQQLFWTASGSGRALNLLPFNYLLEEKKWVPAEAVFLMPPDANIDASIGRWNQNCLNCHSVAPQPRPSAGSGADTRVAELGIGCEACHGSAAEHVRQRQNPFARYRQHFSEKGDATIVNPGRLPAAQASEVCGQCHSIFVFKSRATWKVEGPQYRAGAALGDDRYLLRGRGETVASAPKPPPGFRESHFWSDGTVRVSGREYSALMDSQCFADGHLSCLDCHSMHHSEPNDQLRADKSGDRACAPCHSGILAALSQHTHHLAESSGSRCQNCHMPYTTWGLLKAIRSHDINAPRTADLVTTDRPNACNLCHLDRTLAWTASALEQWYGQTAPELDADHTAIAASVLWSMRGDAAQRAVVAWSMGWEPARQASGSNWMTPYLAELLDDPYAAVRLTAWRALRQESAYAGLAYDYVGPGQDRKAARDAVMAGAAAVRDPRLPRPELLIDRSGTIKSEMLTALLQQRDDRPVALSE